MKKGIVTIYNIKDLPEIQVIRMNNNLEAYSKVWHFDLTKSFFKSLKLLEELLNEGYEVKSSIYLIGITKHNSIDDISLTLKSYMKRF